MAFSKNDHRIAGDSHCTEFFKTVCRFRIVEVVEGINFCGDLPLEIQHSLVIDLAVQRRVAWSALFHKLRKQPGFVGGEPLCGHVAKNPLADGFSFPIGNDFTRIGSDVFFRDGIALLVSGIEDVEVLDAVAG